jgi:hypothetical protein
MFQIENVQNEVALRRGAVESHKAELVMLESSKRCVTTTTNTTNTTTTTTTAAAATTTTTTTAAVVSPPVSASWRHRRCSCSRKWTP